MVKAIYIFPCQLQARRIEEADDGILQRLCILFNITGFTSDLLKHDAASTPLIPVQHTIKILDLRFGDGVHTHCCHSHKLKKL